jgi:hypothetical protein
MATEGDVADGQSKFVADFESHTAGLENKAREKGFSPRVGRPANHQAFIATGLNDKTADLHQSAAGL